MEKVKSILKNRLERNKWIARCLVTMILIVYLWAAFPGYGFHTWYTSSTSSSRYVSTETLSDTDIATQQFTPILPYLKSIQFAVKFNNEFAGNEKVTFSLYNDQNKLLSTCDIPIADMASKRYYEVEIHEKLKKGKTYYWSLSAPANPSYEWQMMYTDYPEDQAPENTSFLINNTAYGQAKSQTISQYTYYDHHDKVVIISGFWASGIFVYLIILEIINRIFKRFPKSK